MTSKTKDSMSDSDDGDDGEGAWGRLTDQTTPLNPKKRNRHTHLKHVKPAQQAKNPQKAAGLPQSSRTRQALLRPVSPTPPPIRLPQDGLQDGPQDGLQDGLDVKTRRRLRRGQTPIEGRLDLHGMTADKAHAALRRFIADSAAQNKKWVLVITGKGVRGEGVLRARLPDWLARAPLAGQVVEYGVAALTHGGGGAFYLRLRRVAL